MPLIGYVGNIKAADLLISEEISEIEKKRGDLKLFEIDFKSGIDQVRNFQIQIRKNFIAQKIGVIRLINKFSDQNIAVLLKTFEELEDLNVVCFYTASYLPSYVIATRSFIHYLNKDYKLPENIEKKEIMDFLIYKMKSNQFSDKLKEAWKIYLNIVSWFEDGVISESEFLFLKKSLNLF